MRLNDIKFYYSDSSLYFCCVVLHFLRKESSVRSHSWDPSSYRESPLHPSLDHSLYNYLFHHSSSIFYPKKICKALQEPDSDPLSLVYIQHNLVSVYSTYANLIANNLFLQQFSIRR